ncbi:MAG: septation protein IspZ [Pseudomonadota bacterium]
MDRRLLIELLPAAIFLIGNALGGLWIASGAAIVATAAVTFLLWHWERAIPWLALMSLGLSVLFLAIGLVFDDAEFIKIRATIGALIVAVLFALGAMMRPSLLYRTFAHRLTLVPEGWKVLSLAWIGLALLSAGANEVVRRWLSDDGWALYSTLSGPVFLGFYWLVTYLVAEWYWDEEEEEDED